MNTSNRNKIRELFVLMFSQVSSSVLKAKSELELVIALMVLVSFPQVGAFGQELLSQKAILERIIPMTPEAAQFKVYGNLAVNNAKGLPDISIPLYDIALDGLSVPISLSYNAHGLKVNDITGSYGANWLMHAGGMIYRNIAGRADERTNGIGWFGCYPNCVDLAQSASVWNSNPGVYQQQIMGYPENDMDIMPDQFGYSFGSNSGEFMYTRQGALIKSKKSTLKIEKFDGYDSGGFFIYFRVTDGQGNKYYFGETENSREYNDSKVKVRGDIIPYRSGEGVTGWKLSRIVTALGETINFSYVEYEFSYQVIGSQEYSEYGTESDKYVDSYSGDIHYHPNYSETIQEYIYDCRLISSIQTPYTTARFVYRNIAYTTSWSKALDSLIISNNQYSVVKAYAIDIERIDSRLFLNSIKELDNSRTMVLSEGYQFQYSGACPAIGSLGQDYFGFNNDYSNQTLIYSPSNIDFDYGGNRRVSIGSVSAGTLQTIIYPTGGKTEFEFEENQEGTRFAPGLRLKRMYEMDENDQIFSDRRFTYEGLTGYTVNQVSGIDSGFIRNYPISPLWGTLYVLQSHDPRIKYLDCADYYYQTVVESLYKEDIETGRITNEYHGYINGDSYVTVPFLRTVEEINGSNSILHLREEMYYDFDLQVSSPFFIKEDPYYELLAYETNYYPGFVLKYIRFTSGLLTYAITKELFNEAADTVFKERSLTYNSRGQVIKEVESNRELFSLGAYKSTTKRISYIEENTSDETCQLMCNLNMFDRIVEISHEVNGLVTGANLTYYNNFNGLYLPEKVLSLIEPYSLGSPPTAFVKFNYSKYDIDNPEVTYTQYSTTGKPLEMLSRDGIKTSITWHNNYPTVIIKRSISDPLLYEITTYTYKPLIGITSKEDTNGRTLHYEYDGFGRLKFIRDHNYNIMRRIDYNYNR
jgi:YD repeat-containing protein